MTYVPRLAERRLDELATNLRVVMLSGPRQSGKTTLLTRYVAAQQGTYRTLDTASTLRAASDDPAAFVAYGNPPRGIDEVQLGGNDLVRAIKVAVDRDPRPGRFLLSGSSRFLTIPKLSESLAGRVAFVELWPLSMRERTGSDGDFSWRVFHDLDALVQDSTWRRSEYLNCVVAGGYPEVLTITSDVARRAWYDGYLSTVINRDIQDFASITRADALSRLLEMIAVRAGSLAVITDLASSVELARDTTRDYLSYLDMVFLTTRVPAWSANLTARLTKSAKLYPSDSGLAAHLLGATAEALDEPGHPQLGPLLETFVAAELTKAIAYSDNRVGLFHLRGQDKQEVDFLLEGTGGQVVAIEVKASTSPGRNSLKGLRWARNQLGDRLHAGILLHLGTEAASHGDGIYAMPVSALWSHAAL
jgi:hypothetical protein